MYTSKNEAKAEVLWIVQGAGELLSKGKTKKN
jgi:hypothetical protein